MRDETVGDPTFSFRMPDSLRRMIEDRIRIHRRRTGDEMSLGEWVKEACRQRLASELREVTAFVAAAAPKKRGAR